MVIIGYSGHAFVACGILRAAGTPVTAYCDIEEKSFNPFELRYLGNEDSEHAISIMKNENYFIGVGDNSIRMKVFSKLSQYCLPVNAVHPSAIIDPSAKISEHGVMIAAGVCINPLAEIMEGAICNTSSVVEHECVVGRFAHVGPGAVLCGNVKIGEGSFVGAAAVIRQNITIGKNAMIGAGAVVTKDVEDNSIVIGNPSRKFEK